MTPVCSTGKCEEGKILEINVFKGKILWALRPFSAWMWVCDSNLLPALLLPVIMWAPPTPSATVVLSVSASLWSQPALQFPPQPHLGDGQSGSPTLLSFSASLPWLQMPCECLSWVVKSSHPKFTVSLYSLFLLVASLALLPFSWLTRPETSVSHFPHPSLQKPISVSSLAFQAPASNVRDFYPFQAKESKRLSLVWSNVKVLNYFFYTTPLFACHVAWLKKKNKFKKR